MKIEPMLFWMMFAAFVALGLFDLFQVTQALAMAWVENS